MYFQERVLDLVKLLKVTGTFISVLGLVPNVPGGNVPGTEDEIKNKQVVRVRGQDTTSPELNTS